MGKYPIGIDGLDRELGGGIDPGTLVGIETDSASQGDSLLRHLAAQQPTLYISTTRTEEHVEEWLQDHQLVTDLTHIHVKYIDGDRKLAVINEYLDNLNTPVNVVIDPVNRFESEDIEDYIRSLHRLKSYLQTTRRIGYLHAHDCLSCTADDNCQNCTATYRSADMVWKLSSEVTTKEINTQLAVTKRRAGATPERPLKLRMGTNITVDTSRNISV